MTMIEVVSPSLSDYMSQVRDLALRYIGNPDCWYELKEEAISDENDRDEFRFIRMALWDKLMDREFFLLTGPPDNVNLFGQCDTTEPGTLPGSFILDGDCWVLSNTPSLSIAY